MATETASVWKLAGFMAWSYEGALPYIVALAYNALLFGSLIALAQKLPEATRKRIMFAGFVLFAVQTLANVTLSYEHALEHAPVVVVTRLYGLDQETAYKLVAVIQGSVLSVVAVPMWGVLAVLLQRRREQVDERQQALREVDSMLRAETSPFELITDRATAAS